MLLRYQKSGAEGKSAQESLQKMLRWKRQISHYIIMRKRLFCQCTGLTILYSFPAERGNLYGNFISWRRFLPFHRRRGGSGVREKTGP
jgi:hypothetical protein